MGDWTIESWPVGSAAPATPSAPSPNDPATSAANGLTQQAFKAQSATDLPRPEADELDDAQCGSDGDNDVDSESDDDDKYRLIGHPEVARGLSALRKRGDAAFSRWIEKSQRLSSKLPKSQVGGIDRMSTAHLIQSEERSIIASPREYQVELFERAKERNIIVVLDTGSGKTLIAALLLRHTLDQELERRAFGQPKKVAFFLVEKVALCFQQYSVLRANLEHPVAKFHGEMAGVMRTKEFWDKQIADNMVFVCTAQIVLDCLSSGFLHISQVNLLIFDEAHHTKKNHPYARIIKDHYLREPDLVNRPRILGMTASPVDSQTRDLRAAAVELESILCSEIATVSDETLMQSQAQRRQAEVKEYYDRLIKPEDARTPLWKGLAELISDDAQYRVHFDATQEAASILGAHCADRYWELLMTDADVGRRVAKAQGPGNFTADGVSEADRVLATLQQAQKIIRANAAVLNVALMNSKAFSSKLKALRHILEDAFRRGSRRCIVFVQKRFTALLLADVFQHIDIPNIRAACLVGSQAMSSSITNMSFRDQVVSLQRFRRGETNCLFATQVAEEGIDIPECDLIVRFDLYDSAIQYIQSKGRARQAKSTYISMLEQGNMQHLRRLMQATRDANALRQFCSALPADRKIDMMNNPHILLEHERIAQKVYEIAETRARLTLSSSQEVLSKFVSSLACNDASSTCAPEYIITSSTSKKFVATIIFPDSSPIKSIRGFAQRNKQLARCSAAFEACVDLIKKKYINGHLQPTLGKRLPAMRNARLALSANKREEYVMRVKAEMWSQVAGAQVAGAPTELFQAVLALDNPEAVGRRPTSPLILLSKHPLPRLEPTLLYLDQGTSLARILPMPKPLRLSSDAVEALANFTLVMFADVFSKEFDAGPEQMPYFVAPSTIADTKDLDRGALIDWKQLNSVVDSEPPDWRDAPDDFFRNKFVMDPWDGSRKFIIHGVNKGLRPSDPVPEGAPMPKSRAYRLVEQNIKEYSNSLTINSRKRQVWDENQPVVNAELLSLRRNFLDEYGTEEAVQDMRCCLILEPLRISRLPVEVVSMALILPIMMHRVDSVLITLEACALLDLDIRPDLALEALTKDSSNTEEHGQEQVDFQIGMGNNYERLEFLGDAFLKMATTVSLFSLLPNTNEFEYHVERMLLVCNQNLFNHAVDRKLQEYVRSKSFDRRTWYPNLQLKKGKVGKAEVRHSLSDKSIADVCEALIGAAYIGNMGAGAGEMDLAVKAVTKMVKSKNHKMVTFGEYYEAYKIPDWQTVPASASQRVAVDRIHEATGYRFQWPLLLRSAFKHPSYPYEAIPNYQRLEFLGDALLDLAIVEYLFKRFPDADPQWLTEHKMAMASNHFFGSLCVQLGLQRHLLMTTSSLIGQIGNYVAELELAQEAARLEVQGEGRDARKDFWLAASQPPKVLSDMLEALVGAMFVDARYDYGVVRRFFASFIQPYFEDMALYDTYASRHPVTALARAMQGQLGCMRWRLYVSAVPVSADRGAAALTDDDVVCALVVHERVVEHSTGKTARDAKLVVAKMALRRFEGVEREAFRAEMGCDCYGKEAEAAEATSGGDGLSQG